MKIRRALPSYNIVKSFITSRGYCYKVPATPLATLEKRKKDNDKIDKNTLALLERLSLVKCDTQEGVKVLEDSIAFADKILHINTENVKPLYSVLEDENLYLRPDNITQGNCQKDILKNAVLTEDDYFVAPPGNIPLHEVQSEDISREELKNIVETKGYIVKYIVEKPGQLLMQNIYCNWLRFINTKTSKHMGLFSNKEFFQETKDITLPIGYLNCKIPDFNNDITLEYNLSECTHISNSRLDCNIFVPQQDVMQYFIQWQRYRKFWWSSITTTPSLFSMNDIKYIEDSAEVDIEAQYSWGKQIVETVQITPSQTIIKNSSCLNCSMSLEGALIYILLDAQTNQNKEEYLRLHRKMAPYKISFALCEEENNDKTVLQELAKLLHHRLNMRKISTWLPDWSLSSESQISENLVMGVTYTAVLSQKTLENGILHLLNSSTMLKEEVHVADFDDYATLLFSN